VSLLLLFRRGYGDWPERPTTPAASPAIQQQDRFLIAPKVEQIRRPLTPRKPLTKLR